MKKLIRLIIKVPATPFVVIFLVFAIIFHYVTMFIEWAYESSDFSKSITKQCLDDDRRRLKKWFTTI